MIIADLKNSSRYQDLHPDFQEVFEYIKGSNWQEMAFGKIQPQGKRWFVIYSNPECLAQNEQVLEYHKKYLDIHVLLEGQEIIGWKSLSDCSEIKKEFDFENDYGLYNDQPTMFAQLIPNQFAIVYPEDAHAPIIGKGKIKKIVAKIEV